MAVASRQIVKLVDGRAFLVSEEILKHMSAVDLINGLMEKGEKFTAAKVDFSKKSQTSLRVIGNDAFLVKEKIERDLDLVEFVSKIDLTNHPFDSGLLPANTIQCVGSDTIKVVVVELEPAVRPILYAGYQYGEKKGDRLTRTGGRRFNISLPYLYTFWKFQIVDSGLSFSGMHVFATPEPISGEKDILYECPLPNIFGGGGCCLGTMDTSGYDTNLRERIDKYLNLWLSAQFNDDLSHKPPGCTSYASWEKKSAENPAFILEQIKTSCATAGTYKEILQSIVGTRKRARRRR